MPLDKIEGILLEMQQRDLNMPYGRLLSSARIGRDTPTATWTPRR